MRFLTPFVLITAIVLGGCDYLAQKELKPGVSTVAEVREYMGVPETIWEEPDGTQIHEYPVGLNTYMISISQSGIFQAMTNVLTEAQFKKVVAGTSKETVRRLLGRPADVVYLERLKELVWTYAHQGKIEERDFFDVHFDTAGTVIKTAIRRDYGPGGN
ncbi:MAG: hypothetical protein WBD13_00130 [Burkholderiaceae bacterium]